MSRSSLPVFQSRGPSGPLWFAPWAALWPLTGPFLGGTVLKGLMWTQRKRGQKKGVTRQIKISVLQTANEHHHFEKEHHLSFSFSNVLRRWSVRSFVFKGVPRSPRVSLSLSEPLWAALASLVLAGPVVGQLWAVPGGTVL